jgi:hypothetical protein
MKTERKTILSLGIAATVFLAGALTATAGPRPEIAREIQNLDRSSDYLVNDVKRALHYRGVRRAYHHPLYRAAKNLDNNVERLEDDFKDREGARKLIGQLNQINRDLFRFERSAREARILRGCSRSLQWTRASVGRLNAFADAFIKRRGHDRQRGHHWNDRHDYRDRRPPHYYPREWGHPPHYRSRRHGNYQPPSQCETRRPVRRYGYHEI